MQTKTEFMTKSFMTMSSSTCYSLSYQYINRMIYYVYGIDEKNFNSHQHNNVAALKTAIVYVVANVPNTHLVIAKISRDSL